MKNRVVYKLLILFLSVYLLIFCYAILDITGFFGLFLDESRTENSDSISNIIDEDSNENTTLIPSIFDSDDNTIIPSCNEDLDSSTISEIEPTPDINKVNLTNIKTSNYYFKNLYNYFLVSSYNEFISLNYDDFGLDVSSLYQYDEDYFVDNSLLFFYGIRNNYYLDDYSFENYELKIYLKEKQEKYNNHCFYLLSANKEILENFNDIDFYLNDKEFIDSQNEETMYKYLSKHFTNENYCLINNYDDEEKLYLISENKNDSEIVVNYLDDSYTIKNTSNLYIYNKDLDKLIDINNFLYNESYNKDAHKKFVYDLIEKNAISKFTKQYGSYDKYTNYGFYEINQKVIFVPYFSSNSLIDGNDIYIDGVGFHYLTTNEISLYYNEEFLSLTKAYEDNLINKEFLQDLAFIHNQNTYFKLVDLYPLLNELVDDYSKVTYIHKNYFKYSYSTIEQSHYSDDSYIIKVILDKIMNVKLTVTNNNIKSNDNYYEIITDEWSLIIPYDYHNYKGINLEGNIYDIFGGDYEECLNFKFENESYNFYCNGEIISVDSSVLTSFYFKKIAYEYVYEIKDNYFDTLKPIYIVEEDIIKYDDQYYKIIFKGEKIASLYKPIEKCHLTIKDENGYLCNIVYKKGTSIKVSYLIKDFTFPFSKDMVLSYEGTDENISINDDIILGEDKILYIKSSSK